MQSDEKQIKVLKSIIESKQTVSMNPQRSDIDPSTILPGMASRVSTENDSGLTRMLQEVGPSCTNSTTTFRNVVSEISKSTGPVTDASLASLLFFFSGKYGDGNSADPSGLSQSLLGSLMSGRGSDQGVAGGSWNLKVVAQLISEDYGQRDWRNIARSFDFPSFHVKDSTQFSTLMDLFRAGAGATPPLSAFTSNWRNASGQLSIIEHMMSVPPSVYMVPLNDEEVADAATAPPPGPTSAPNPQCWASSEILQCLLYLSDNPSLYRRIRDLFVKCLLSCPEVLLCSLVRLQLKVSSEGNKGGLINAGVALKTDVMRELIPLFFRPNTHQRVRNSPPALRRLYVISPSTITAGCYEAWKTTATETTQVKLATVLHIIDIARLLPSPPEAVASLLNSNKDAEFSIAVAFVMADNDYLQLKPWLTEKMSGKTSVITFAVALVAYMRKMHTWAAPKGGGPDGKGAPLVSVENIAVSLQLLQSLDTSILAQSVATVDSTLPSGSLGDNVKALIDSIVASYPSLRGSFAAQTGGTSTRPQQPGAPATPDDVEEMATQYFQKIYTSEQSIGEVVEMLKRFKTSGRTKENEIFACMVHNLFDEYRFFSKYPQKELRITGILFGALIQEQLVSSITLGIALRYVLEALRKTPSPPGTSTMSGKMFNFGMYALEQFKGRLHEWPQYCSHIVQIPHLKEGYAELVAEIEQEMTRRLPDQGPSGDTGLPASSGQDGASLNQSQSMPMSSHMDVSSPSTQNRVAEFGPKLGRAVTDGEEADSDFEAPPDSVLDKVQLLVNNLAQSNVDKKALELQQILEPRYFDWLGHFLVVRRISTQANYHSLYLSFLDSLGEYGKGLMESIIRSVYKNIGKLLRSPKITTSSSERSYLKNLGIWLGQITLSRNRPILQIMLDAKELLLQGYETGKLIAVAPFLAKTLEGAKNSKVFRPPNPWLMGILGVFRSVYLVDGLKMNIKFEVEVLCKNLGIKLEEIPLRNDILGPRIAPNKDRNPDFNIKSASAGNKPPTGASTPIRSLGSPAPETSSVSAPGSDERAGQDLDTLIPNLAAYVTVNPNLPQIFQSSGSAVFSNVSSSSLKRWVPVAVDRAIREIITPVVERSVTIACITTKEVVTKDFSMEGDESKVRKAGQLMVSNLAGNLALVTCREPLRSSVSTHLRQLFTTNLGRNEKLSEQDQNVIEQCVQMCATDNLELGCMLIEKATTEKAARDVEEALASAVNARRTHREQSSQPFYDTSVVSSTGKYPAALPEQLRPQPGGLGVEHFQLYDNFRRPSQQVQGDPNADRLGPRPGGPSSAHVGDSSRKQPSPPQSGTEPLSALSSKLDGAITALLTAAGSRASEVKLSMLPADHQIRQLLSAVKQVMPNAGPNGPTRQLSTSEQDLVLSFSQIIFKRLYELSLNEPLRLEALVVLLENINLYCPKLGKDMGTWSTYAPTNTDQQRRLHRTVLLLLIRSKLLAVHELDAFLAARADNGSNHVWLEFSLLFIRTAFMERIATSTDFPKLIELMARVAEGRSQARPNIVQTFRKSILQMLEETRATPQGANRPMPSSPVRAVAKASALSRGSLESYGRATRRVAEATQVLFSSDPPEAEAQVSSLLDAWIRLKSETETGDQALVQYMQLLQRFGVGKSEIPTERFFRLATLVVVDAVLKNGKQVGNGPRSLNHAFIDYYSDLLVLLFRHMNSGGSGNQVNAQRLSVLNKILGSIVRSMMWHHEKSKGKENPWDQRPWFRLLLNLVIDLNKPDPAFEPIRLGMLSVFGAAFHVCQPLVLPAFSFAWFELVSHRHFLPNLLLRKDQKGWNIVHELLADQLLFLQPYLARTELPTAVKKLYEGTLRVLLVVLHDFPSFLACFHVSFCNVIPENCVQLRNIVLTAAPKGMNPPDPFTPNLKIDLLPEITQSPTILSNVLGPIASFRSHLDLFLEDGQRQNFLVGLPSLLNDSDGFVDGAKVNSLVLYIGAHALARMQSSQISVSRTPEIEVMQRLMELDDRNRYTCLNAIANQLRFPSSHTHYFSCVILTLFGESKNVAVKEQITRVLLERLIVNRPHPWGLLITFIELIKNQHYGFWNYPFTRCAAEIEKVFESVARSCMPPGTQRSALVGGGDDM